MKVNANLPCLILCKDYHDFDDLERKMRTIINRFKLKEIGVDAGEYVGLAWVGKSPSAKVLQKLLDEMGIKHIHS
jgi:hypothetical protein